MSAPQFMTPLVAWLTGVLENADLGELGPFAEVKQSWTGVVVNWPPAAVMAEKSQFDPAIEGCSHSQNLLTVKFGVQNADSDQLTADAMAYMQALDAAIRGAAAPENAARVFVQDHDYGLLYEKNGSFAKFPELHVLIEVYE